MTTPLDYMLHALQLAERGRLTVSPNPMVGCVIVKNKQIIGEGFHQKSGEAHAEVYALQQAGAEAKEATVYVTLEPCCHHGKTPPCTDALIAAGVTKVCVATLDPNPLVAGKGVAALRAAGIEVKIGLCETEAKQLNEIFFHYIIHKRPFVIAKWAMSLDGKTITHPEDSRDISSTEARIASHTLREQVDAILIGANTATQDNPQLTARLNDSTHAKQPIRIVLSSQGNLPTDLKIFDATLPGKTIVVTTKPINTEWQEKMPHVECVQINKNADNKIDLLHLLTELGKRHITSLLVEGGMRIHESFFAASLVNKVQVYVAPVIIGNLSKKHTLNNIQVEPMSADYCFSANFPGINHV